MKAIVAVDRNWGIGCRGKLLETIKEDMQFFKEKTMGKVVVMGRDTFLSLPGPKALPGRKNFVLTTRDDFMPENVTICNSIPDVVSLILDHPEEDIFIIGGASVYAQTIHLCKEAYVTKFDHEYPADCYFPNLDEKKGWKIAETERNTTTKEDGTIVNYEFVRYINTSIK